MQVRNRFDYSYNDFGAVEVEDDGFGIEMEAFEDEDFFGDEYELEGISESDLLIGDEAGAMADLPLLEVDVAADAVSTVAVTEMVLGAAGVVLGIGFVIYDMIQNSNDLREVIQHIDDVNQEYQRMIDDFERS